MDYKKLYEEALERAKSVYNADKVSGLEVRTCEQIFPELAESEDEKIRKDLITYFKYKTEEGKDTCYGIPIADIISWLEKQKHDGKKWIYEDEYQKDLDRLYEDGKDEVLNSLEKYGLQKKCEWSDKDEKRMEDAISIVNQYSIICKREGDVCDISDRVLDWLKTIKGRVQPQPKQEWSEEDERISNAIYESIDFLVLKSLGLNEDDVIDWLKSHKPQTPLNRKRELKYQDLW